MKNLTLDQPIRSVNRTQPALIVQRFLVVLFIFIFIQALNQFLILTGSALEESFLGNLPYTRVWVGVYQQLIQATFGILLAQLLLKKNLSELGINLENKSRSMRYFALFTSIWLSVIMLYLAAAYFIFPQVWDSLRSAPLLKTDIFLSTIFFQAIFPGLGEEILFRGLFVSLLATLVFPNNEEKLSSKIGVIFVSGLYFSVAHIYFSLSPLQITHFDGLQVLTAMGCGWFYAIAYLNTKSLLAPFLAHNFSNVTASICAQIISSL